MTQFVIHSVKYDSSCPYMQKFNPFKLNAISRSYQLDQFISVLKVVGWYFSFFIQILIGYSVRKQWRP